MNRLYLLPSLYTLTWVNIMRELLHWLGMPCTLLLVLGLGIVIIYPVLYVLILLMTLFGPIGGWLIIIAIGLIIQPNRRR